MASVVNGSPGTSAGREIDLSRLNEAELRVLRLLGEGHTVKSIANLIGFTPVAVNERLREARRKTGVGSSWELARVLKAHENYHKQFGVGEADGSALPAIESDANVWQPQTGVIVMIALFLVVTAGAAALMSQAPTSSLRAAFTRIPKVGARGSRLSVTCAATLCEVGGTVDTTLANSDAGRREFNEATMSKLNPKALSEQTDRLNLESVMASIAQTPDKSPRLAFLFYYVRRK